MNVAVTRLNDCRICSGQKLTRFLHLPEMPFTDNFISPEEFGREFRHDIDIYLCEDCLTAQTQHDVDVRGYYEDYQYSVGSSPAAARFMRLLADRLLSKYFSRHHAIKVLEVGSGDGAQLAAFREYGCSVLGYEPSSFLAQTAESKAIPTIQGLFGADSLDRLPAEFRKVDVIALSYTFDHLPRPREFLAATHSILNSESGLLVVEVHDLQKIFERQEFCLFEHEHSIYLTAASAAALLEREGLVIIDLDLVPEADRRANSLLFVATPKNSIHAKRFALSTPAVPAMYRETAFYQRQAAMIRRAVENLDLFVDRMTSDGKTIAGYGAGGRGVMTLAAMRSAPKIRYLADRKPKRSGLLAPKSGVALVGLSALKNFPVSEILVFSFGYMQEIQAELGEAGYNPHQFHSLLDVLAGKAIA